MLLKDKLISASFIIIKVKLPSELSTDASDLAVGACLGEYVDKKSVAIAYLSKSL